MAALIEMRDVKKSFGENVVLDGINLEVEQGDIVAIIGSSGSGKSTMVRCLAGLEDVRSGKIFLRGEEITDRNRAVGSIGMVFQNFNLFPHYTVEENIIKPLRTVKRMGAGQAKEKAEELLGKVRLSEAAGQYPSTMSGGQKQRLAIARALAMNPEILVFDEPTSSLDPELAYEVFRTIKDLAAEGQTMLIVTHQINAVRHFATRVAFLDSGKIEADGTCSEIFEHSDNQKLKQFLAMVEYDAL